MVEFALILPLIAIFLLGMMQVGFALNARQQLEGVARQGARTFALTADPDVSREAVRLAGRQLASFNTRASMTSSLTDANGGPKGGTSGGGLALMGPERFQRGDWITIELIYQYPNPIQASVFGFRLPASIPIGTSATARVERAASGTP